MNYLLKTFLPLALALCCQQAQAQAPGRLSGLVTNADNKPLEGATVSLVRVRDSVLVKAFITGADGRFEFMPLRADTCVVAVSFIGFASYASPALYVGPDQPVLDLPAIQLQGRSGETLGTVTVQAARPFVERRIDRTIINPDALISNGGANTLEVLEKSPGVQVDIDGSISLRGKQGVLVLIDDKPTHLSAAALASYLRSLPASVLNSIEIMTTPPAKYDASGNAGVINIRLKKNTVKGWSGSINASYAQGTYARSNNSISFNYRVNKVNFFGNVSGNTNNDYQTLDIERHYIQPNGSLNSIFRQHSFIKNQRRSMTARLGMDYYLSKKATFGVVLNGFRNPATVTTTSNADLLNAAMGMDSMIMAHNRQQETSKNGSVNLNFNYDFDGKGRTLTLNADRIHYGLDADQGLTTSTYLPDHSLKSQSQLTALLPTDIDITTAKADYVHPVKNGRFEGGAKTTNIATDNIADFFNGVNGTTTVNYDLTNRFKYKERIQAAYVNASFDFNRLSVQAGLRLEHTGVDGHQLGNARKPDSAFTHTYTSLFPTFYLSYKLDSAGSNQLGLSYGRRIQRPNYQDLNPFVYPLDQFTFFAGNPYLQPTFSHNIELSHTYKNILTTTLQYSHIRDIIQETIEQNGTLFISRPGNIGQQTDIGISMNAGWQPGKIKWWTLQLYAEVINNHFKGILYNEPLDAQKTYWLFNGSSQFKLSKLWSAEVGGFYKSASVSGQFRSESVGLLRLSVQRKIFKERGSLKLTGNDVLYTFQPRGRIVSISNATATYHNYLDSRVVTIAFSYRLSKGSSLRARQSGASDTEKSRVKLQ